MIKHTTVAMAAIVACSTAVFAQSGSTPSTQPMNKDMKAGTVSVTGCVAQGTTPGNFMLENATMADAMAKDTMATPDKAKSTDSSMMMSYTLSGGDNLKAHVGHKVTITGTMDKMGAMAGEKMPPATTAGAQHDMKGGTLKVQALKMVSATCP